MFETAEVDSSVASLEHHYKSSKPAIKQSGQLLYLKLTIDASQYLVLLSDIVEIKNTNLVSPVVVPSAKKNRIYGAFYYQHNVIPVYKLKIEKTSNGTKVYISSDEMSALNTDYYNLIIFEDESNYGVILNNLSSSEIIDINFADTKSKLQNYEIIDLKKIISNL